MKRFLRHRFALFALVLTFGVSNVGLPIAISLCPLMKIGQKGWCCQQNDGPPAFSKYHAMPCCKVLVAEKNASAFEARETQSGAMTAPMFLSVILSSADILDHGFTGWVLTSPSPPARNTIPILISSLLI